MALTTFSPNTLIQSSVMNSNLSGLSDGTNDATANSLQTFRDESLYDFIASGLVITGDSLGVNKNASTTAGVVIINGKRSTTAVVSARTYTASKDTYIYVDDTGAFTYTEVSNNAASPSIPANSILVGIVVTGATTIAAAGSINQGDPTCVLPIASSNAYSVTDSLGNLIANRTPTPTLIGYRQLISAPANTSASTTPVAITGLDLCPAIIPTGRRAKLVVFCQGNSSVANDINEIYFRESTTQLASCRGNVVGLGGHDVVLYAEGHKNLSAGLHTFNAAFARASGTGTCTIDTFNSTPIFIKVELE